MKRRLRHCAVHWYVSPNISHISKNASMLARPGPSCRERWRRHSSKFSKRMALQDLYAVKTKVTTSSWLVADSASILLTFLNVAEACKVAVGIFLRVCRRRCGICFNNTPSAA